MDKVSIGGHGLAYSILFKIEGDNDTWAADWYSDRKRWTLSYMEFYTTFHRWYGCGDMKNDEKGMAALRAIAEEFGLPKMISLEEVAMMSPCELSKLGTKDPLSCTMRDDRRASEVRD